MIENNYDYKEYKANLNYIDELTDYLQAKHFNLSVDLIEDCLIYKRNQSKNKKKISLTFNEKKISNKTIINKSQNDINIHNEFKQLIKGVDPVLFVTVTLCKTVKSNETKEILHSYMNQLQKKLFGRAVFKKYQNLYGFYCYEVGKNGKHHFHLLLSTYIAPELTKRFYCCSDLSIEQRNKVKSIESLLLDASLNKSSISSIEEEDINSFHKLIKQINVLYYTHEQLISEFRNKRKITDERYPLEKIISVNFQYVYSLDYIIEYLMKDDYIGGNIDFIGNFPKEMN